MHAGQDDDEEVFNDSFQFQPPPAPALHVTVSSQEQTSSTPFTMPQTSSDLDDSGVDPTCDIDIQEATSYIRTTPGTCTSDRPTVGIKRPRTHVVSIANKFPRRQAQTEPDCPWCKHLILLAEIKELKESNALLSEHLNRCRLQAANATNQSGAPKPGKVSKELAENHQTTQHLEELPKLSEGSSKFMFQKCGFGTNAMREMVKSQMSRESRSKEKDSSIVVVQ
ncbi:hypothetical protein ACROYT_G025654 [Oculina patagonica]